MLIILLFLLPTINHFNEILAKVHQGGREPRSLSSLREPIAIRPKQLFCHVTIIIIVIIAITITIIIIINIIIINIIIIIIIVIIIIITIIIIIRKLHK